MTRVYYKKFLKELINASEALISNQSLKPHKDFVNKCTPRDFDYQKFLKGSHSFQFSLEEKQEWFFVVSKCLTEVSKKNFYVSFLASLIALDLIDVEDKLEQFSRRYLSFYLSGQHNELEQCLRDFKDFVKGKSSFIKGRVELVGIIPADFEILLSSKIRFRQIQESDLISEKPYYRGSRDLPVYPSCIVEFDHLTYEQMKFFSLEISKWNQVLSIFFAATVSHLTYSFSGNSFQHKSLTGQYYRDLPRGYYKKNHVLSVSDVEKLLAFQQKSDWFFDSSTEQPSRLSMAIEFLVGSITYPASTEKRLLEVMIAFEALFLDGDGEKSFRLRVLVSRLFSLVGLDPYHISRAMQLAYNYRSDYVHGSLSSKTKKAIVRDFGTVDHLFEVCLCALRITVIIFLVAKVRNEELHKDFLSYIRDSLLHVGPVSKDFLELRALLKTWEIDLPKTPAE